MTLNENNSNLNSASLPDTIGAALLFGENQLKGTHVLRPRRHAELILEKILSVDRIHLYTHAQALLTTNEMNEFNNLIVKRLSGIPIQYIVGWAPFYGREFYVDEGVFIPRFDTEILIEKYLEFRKLGSPSQSTVEVLDLCCGSGIIGLTTALEDEKSRVILLEKSDIALEVTNMNATKHDIMNKIEIVKYDALVDFPDDWVGRFDYILSNPPYIPTKDMNDLHQDVKQEPEIALTDGGDGLTFYKRWTETLPRIMKPNGRFLFEIGDGLSGSVYEVLKHTFNEIQIFKDLNLIDRLITGKEESNDKLQL